MQSKFKEALLVSLLASIPAVGFHSSAFAQVSANTYERDGTTFSFSGSELGSSLTVQDARGVLTYFDYNERGQVTQELSADRGSIQYDYDDNGNLTVERSEGGLIHKRHYDDQNRLIREVMTERGVDRKATRYNYDNCENGLGRLCSVNSNGNVTRYDYSAEGKYTRIATRHDGENEFETTRYFYNEGGGLNRMRYPTGLVVKYHYDENGFVNRLTGRYETGENQDKFLIAKNIRINSETGSLINLEFGNGLKLQQAFDDNLSLLSSDLLKGGTRLDSFAYWRNETGNVTDIIRLDDKESVHYTYDENQRLISERTGQNTATESRIVYSYDAVNNRTQRHTDSRTDSYIYAPTANKLEQIDRQGLTYDVRGNLLEDRKGKRRFEYDVTNRLTSFYKDGELKASYDYNARGQRIRKILQGTPGGASYKALHFAYSPDGQLLSEFGRNADKARRFARDYVWFGNVPIAQIERKVRADGTTRKAKVSYIHVDHLKAPHSASDSDGNIVWQWNRDAYGQGQVDRDVDGDGENTAIRLRFPGQYFDPESKLFYNHFRDYDPKVGRYIQSDPIGLRGGINRYAYVGGNPVNAVDPKGLSASISLTPTNCYYFDYYSNGDFSHSSPVQCDYELDVQYDGNSSVTGNGTLYADSSGGASSLQGTDCPAIDGLKLDAESQRDLEQILNLPSTLSLLQVFVSVGAVVDISDPSGVIPLAMTGESWSQWAGAFASLGGIAENRIYNISALALLNRYSPPASAQDRKHAEFWRAIADGCLTK